MALLAKYTVGASAMSFDCKEYHLYDQNAPSDTYLSMTPLDISKCINGVTILEINWGMGYKSVKIVDSIPESIDGYVKTVS